jgi:hypothetical protein
MSSSEKYTMGMCLYLHYTAVGKLQDVHSAHIPANQRYGVANYNTHNVNHTDAKACHKIQYVNIPAWLAVCIQISVLVHQLIEKMPETRTIQLDTATAIAAG